ncbi:hypothetical protein EJK15_12905 [Nonomuraea basaltis]|nr:hypothetical protein EJK15_12905 [Nonomuraea basaltis]
MAKQTIAEQYVDLMARAGVRGMYGVVGDSGSGRRRRHWCRMCRRVGRRSAQSAGAPAVLVEVDGSLHVAADQRRLVQASLTRLPAARPAADAGPG